MSCRGSTTTTRRENAAARIVVRPQYIPHLRIPDGERFCFAYAIKIHNEGGTHFRLLSRRWTITDGNNHKRAVEGAGVVGEQPRIAPGGAHAYTSYVDFATPVGWMSGAYTMQLDDGEKFDTAIDTFFLAVPHSFN